MERLFHPSDTLNRDKLLVHHLATKDATGASKRQRATTKTTTNDDQDHDLHDAAHPWILCDYVQRSVCNILFRQQPYDDDHFAYVYAHHEEYRQEKRRSAYYYPTTRCENQQEIQQGKKIINLKAIFYNVVLKRYE